MNFSRLSRISRVAVVALLAVVSSFAQSGPSVFSGVSKAWDFAFGANGYVAPLTVDVGTTATGSQTITLAFGQVTLRDGRLLTPLSTTTAITIGSSAGSNLETVTPSAVSCSTPAVYDSCTVTATFTYTHGKGESVSSGSYGIGEAANYTHTLGGLVSVDGYVATAAGSRANAITAITGVKGWTNVTVLDWMGTTGAVSYKALSNGSLYVATTVGLY